MPCREVRNASGEVVCRSASQILVDSHLPGEHQPVAAAIHHHQEDKSRWWEVRDAAGELVCLTVYRRGAREVVRRLSLAAA